MAASGINYGHQFTAATYNSAKVQRDLRVLQKAGFEIIRVAYPPFDATPAVDFCKDIVLIAQSLGLRVIWGVTAGGTTVTLTRWNAHMAYVTGSLAPWAQANGSSALQLSLGNEEELHIDNVTIDQATLQADIKSLATTVQGIYTLGDISYETDALRRASWAALGLGDLDRIGFNVYFQWPPTDAFRINIQAIKTAFPTTGYISEWSTDNGYDGAAVYGADYAEDNWRSNLPQRQAIIDNSGMEHCFFCYETKGGAFGLPANKWPLLKEDGTYRLAWYSVAALRKGTARARTSRNRTQRTHRARTSQPMMADEPPGGVDLELLVQQVVATIDPSQAYSEPTSTEIKALVAVLQGTQGVQFTAEHGAFEGRSISCLRAGTFGMYAHDMPPWLMIQAPHPVYDENTETIALELWRRVPRSYYMLAGAHRQAGGPGGGQGLADPPWNAGSMFNQVSAAFPMPQMQVHGFANSTAPGMDVVLSSASATAGQLIIDIADALDPYFVVARVWEGYPVLTAVGNKQSLNAQANGLPFVHLEINRTVRLDQTRWTLLIDLVAGVLRAAAPLPQP